MTVKLSWLVQNCILTWSLKSKLEQKDISQKLSYGHINHSWTGYCTNAYSQMHQVLLWIPLIMVSALLQPCIRITSLESWLQIEAYGNVLWGINIGFRLSCMISIMWALWESSHIMRKTRHYGFDSVHYFEINYSFNYLHGIVLNDSLMI